MTRAPARPRARAIVATAALLATIGPAAPAAAQGDDAGAAVPASALTLQVPSFTGTLLGDAEFRLLVRIRNAGDAEVGGLALTATLHRRTVSRLGYQEAVDAGDVGARFSGFAEEVEPLPPRGSRVLELVRSAADLGLVDAAEQAGVYPLAVELTRDGDTVETVRTSVVFTPRDHAEPLRVAMVVPIDATPGILADGTYAGSRVSTSIGPGGRVATLVDALHARPVPVTVAHSGLLLEQVADLADGYTATLPDGGTQDFAADSPVALAAAETLAQVREVAEREQTTQLALSYGPTDLVALTRSGLGDEAAALLTHGNDTVARLTGAPGTDEVVWPPDGLDSATLAQVLTTGVDTVVLDEGYLRIPADRDLSFSPSPVRRLRTSTDTITALVPDPFLDQALNATESVAAREAGGAVAAQRIVAETAAVYFERPNATVTRGLLIAPPQIWNPPQGLLESLLDGLAGAPWVEAVDVPRLAATVAPDAGAVTLDYPEQARARELAPAYILQLAAARQTLGALEQVLTSDAQTPLRLDSLLDRAPSVHYRGQLRSEGASLVDTVRAAVGEVSSAVSIAESAVITLTSDEGAVPITLTNASAEDLALRLRFSSAYFVVEGGNVQRLELAANEVLTTTFTVQALAPGATYPLRVHVEDPDGNVAFTEGLVTIRSTGYSVTALLATGGAAVFLLVWWLRDVRGRRRMDAETTAADRTPTPA